MFIESNFQRRCDRRKLKCWIEKFFFFYIGIIWFFSRIVIIGYNKIIIKQLGNKVIFGWIEKKCVKKRIEKEKEEMSNEK